MHGHRIKRHHFRPACGEVIDQHQRRCLAHVVGVGLERQPPQRDGFAGEIFAKLLDDFFCQHMFLRMVDTLHRVEQFHLDPGNLAGALQGLHILRKTRAAVAQARIQKMITNARIGTHALAHRLNVRAEFFGKPRQLIHEGNARGEHGVGGVFGELGRAHVHDHQPVVAALERRIQFAQGLDGLDILGATVVADANHNAVRPHEVLHRRALFQEFGI